MSGIVTNVVRDSGGDCEHLTLTTDLDGESVTIETGHKDPRWSVALDADEKKQLLRLLARWWKGKGESIPDFLGRVLAGEEGSNVRSYILLSREVTKTNIGTAYTNVCPGQNGERRWIDGRGCTQFLAQLYMNAVGTGPWNVRLVRDSDSAVLYESPDITGAGEKELDTDWQTLPAQGQALDRIRLQAKSDTGADDPIFRFCIFYLR